MLKYLTSFIYENVKLVDVKYDRVEYIPFYTYVKKPTRRLYLVPYGRHYRYESRPDMMLTTVPTGKYWNMYVIKDAMRTYRTNRSDIPLNNTTRMTSVLCSVLWFETNNKKYFNSFGYLNLGSKIMMLVCCICLYWFI